MTDLAINDVTPRIQYTATGGQTTFPYPFEIFEDGDLVVVQNTTTLTLTTHYTVTNSGVTGGGDVVLVTGATNGDTITIYRDIPVERTSDYQANGELRAATLNDDFDRIVAMIQQNERDLSRSLTLSQTSESEISPLDGLPNTVVGFDANGDLKAYTVGTDIGDTADMVSHTAGGQSVEETLNQRYYITPEQYGASGDGIADDASSLTTAIAAAISQGKTLVGKGTYRVASNVNFRNAFVDFSQATIDVDHSGVGITIGGHAASPNNPSQRFYIVTRSSGTDAQTTPTIRCIGAKGQYITVERTTYFQIYADTDSSVGGNSGTDYSSAYSAFHLRYVTTVELTNNPSTDGSSVQWINENQFYLNRTNNIYINGTYTHNHNHFYAGTFEGAADIDIETGLDNWITGARFELGPTTINFGALASRNVIEKTWSSSAFSGSTFSQLPNGTITDSGTQNVVRDARAKIYARSVVAQADVADVILDNDVSEINYRDTTLQRIKTTLNGNRNLLFSDYLPVKTGDWFSFLALNGDGGDTLRYRPTMEFYDKNLVPVSSATGFVNSATMTSVSGHTVTHSTGVSAADAIINAAAESGATYCRAVFRSSNGQTANELARTLRIERYTVSDLTSDAQPNLITEPSVKVVSAIPTKGFAPLGYTATKSDGTAFYINTFSLSTTSTNARVGTDTTIDLSTVTGITSGDIIGINLDDRSTHWTTVNGAPSGSTVTLSVAIPSATASGSRVVLNRWATK